MDNEAFAHLEMHDRIVFFFFCSHLYIFVLCVFGASKSNSVFNSGGIIRSFRNESILSDCFFIKISSAVAEKT